MSTIAAGDGPPLRSAANGKRPDPSAMDAPTRIDLVLAVARVLFVNGQSTDQTVATARRAARALEVDAEIVPTIRISDHEIGRTAGEMLLKRLENIAFDQPVVRLPVTLTVRQSSGGEHPTDGPAKV